MGFRTGLHPLGRGVNKHFKPNQVIIASSGEMDITIPNILPAGKYYLEVIGGGGGAAMSVGLVAMGSGGGSGGIIAGYFKIPSGRYVYCSGPKGNDSNMDNVPQNTVMPAGAHAGLFNQSTKEWIALAYGGQGATRPTPAGLGGAAHSSKYQVGDLTAFSSGNNGTSGSGWAAGSGGASLYQGYGKGGDGMNKNTATNGYFRLVYVGQN